MEKKTSHPAWALSFKRKGTELRLLNGRYYLYEVTSKWSPEKKRSVKITGKLLPTSVVFHVSLLSTC